jgi:predicted RNase H-like HicB family nuclease
MERLIHLQIEKLSEGCYLATSDDLQGLLAQGDTVDETIAIARDVAKHLISLQSAHTTVPWVSPLVGSRLTAPLYLSV